MPGISVLLSIVDNALNQQVSSVLSNAALNSINARSIKEVFHFFQHGNPRLLVLESPQSDHASSLDLAKQIRNIDQRFPIILVTTRGSESLATAALRIGVKDYFTHPLSGVEFIDSVNRCLSGYRSRQIRDLSQTSSTSPAIGEFMIGESLVLQKIKAFLLKVAAVNCHVLITGETGTGKELAAQFIHTHSTRQESPLVSINCAALPEALLESELFGFERGAFTGAQAAYEGRLRLANGGTVFLDEIGEMSQLAQSKLLRVLESKEVYPLGGKRCVPLDARIIAATNCDVESLVSENKFRRDLYFRLNVARVHLPPLRERKDDIPHLVDHYLGQFNQKFGQYIKGCSDEAWHMLLNHDWPGNIRELKNVLEGIYIDPPRDEIKTDNLPQYLQKRIQANERRVSDELTLLLSTLHSVNWNKSKAAEALNWSRMTLYRKMAKYQILKSSPTEPRDQRSEKNVVTPVSTVTKV